MWLAWGSTTQLLPASASASFAGLSVTLHWTGDWWIRVSVAALAPQKCFHIISFALLSCPPPDPKSFKSFQFAIINSNSFSLHSHSTDLLNSSFSDYVVTTCSFLQVSAFSTPFKRHPPHQPFFFPPPLLLTHPTTSSLKLNFSHTVS